MGLGLGLGNGVVDLPGPVLYLLGQGQAVDDRPDVSRRGVVVMVVFVFMMELMVMVLVVAVLMWVPAMPLV